ncbi:MAG TPA: hypothetical protein PKK36_06300 [Kiritimatiellia bacterium]|nr:hypothetical protein [Kiritimatiellia bacterium]
MKTLTAFLLLLPAALFAAGQTSETFGVKADVLNTADPSLSAGSASLQGSVSVSQHSLVEVQTSASFTVHSGYQASTVGFDSDYDGIPDSLDADDDGDGVPDSSDGFVYDTDNDGERNLADDDDDNDLLADTEEYSAGTSLILVDTDGDTHTDYEEVVVTGTDAVNSGDYLQVGGIVRPGANGTVISWNAVTGKIYHISGRSSLAGEGIWNDLSGAVTASVESMSWTNTGPVATQLNYRISVPY